MKLISTKLTNLVSLEQSNHKPIGRYGGGLLKLALRGRPSSYLPIGFRWDCSNDIRLVSLEEMSFTEPPWWP